MSDVKSQSQILQTKMLKFYKFYQFFWRYDCFDKIGQSDIANGGLGKDGDVKRECVTYLHSDCGAEIRTFIEYIDGVGFLYIF